MNKLHLLWLITLSPAIISAKIIKYKFTYKVDLSVKVNTRDLIDILETGLPDHLKGHSITPLMMAVGAGISKFTSQLLRDTNSINQQASNGMTALHISISNNSKEIVDILLKEPDINVNLETIDGETPLIIASEEGHYQIVKKLISQCNTRMINKAADLAKTEVNKQIEKVDVKENHQKSHKTINLNIKNKEGSTALHLAFPPEKPNYKIIRLLLSCYELDPNLEEVAYGYGSLPKCIINKHTKLALEFIQHPRINVNFANGYFFETSLMYACKFGNIKVVKALIYHRNQNNKYDINLNQVSREGNTAMHYAAFWNQIDIVQLLLQQANINTFIKNNDEKTAFDIAKEKGYKLICQKLTSSHYQRVVNFFEAIYQKKKQKVKELKASPELNVNTINPYNQGTMLMMACYLEATKIVEVLIKEYAADPSISDLKYRNTPLMIASTKGYSEIVSILLKYLPSKKINQVDYNGNTAFMMACYAGHESTVKMLLTSKEINIYLPDQNGDTPIIVASKKGHSNIVKILLKKSHANYLNQPNQGYGALIGACYHSHNQVVDQLLSCTKINWSTKGKRYYLFALSIALQKQNIKTKQLFSQKIIKYQTPQPCHPMNSIDLLDSILHDFIQPNPANYIPKRKDKNNQLKKSTDNQKRQKIETSISTQ